MSSCSSNTKDFVFEEYKRQLAQKGLKIDSVDNTGLIYITVRGAEIQVSLDNARRDFARDKDTAIIADYVQLSDDATFGLPEKWEDAREQVYTSLFPSDFDFAKFVHHKLTDSIHKIYVVSNSRSLIWIDTGDLRNWQITEAELIRHANSNGNRLLANSKITFDTIDKHRLGMLETEDETLKPALLLAPSLIARVKRDFGSPFYAVIPVRNFCYIFSSRDFDFFSTRLGSVVVDEYKKSGHPLTTELLKFSNAGVEAVGAYPVE
ncbi:MAG: hypothetical protein V4649_10255 [Bacteroidota bacterium]